jgi:hypothetical protein
MKYRKKIRSKKSKKLFRKTAQKVHPKNGRSRPMRGGIRL